MNKYILNFLTIIIIYLFSPEAIIAQPSIGIYPPQVHQQICQESTYTRYLGIYNYGKDSLVFSAEFTPGPYDWVNASPLSGKVASGDTLQIAFLFNSAGLAIDNYYAYLQFNSNDPVSPDTTVLAMLHVQSITIFVEPENDSICAGCNTTLNTMAFGCSEEYQFAWTSDPPGFTSTEKSPVINPSVNTTYTVHVTDGGGSADKSVYIQVYGSSGIDESEDIQQVTIFPNPTSGDFSIQFNAEKNERGIVKITDLSGRLIYSEEIGIIPGKIIYQIQPGQLDPGIYHLSIEHKENHSNMISFKNKLIIN